MLLPAGILGATFLAPTTELFVIVTVPVPPVTKVILQFARQGDACFSVGIDRVKWMVWVGFSRLSFFKTLECKVFAAKIEIINNHKNGGLKLDSFIS